MKKAVFIGFGMFLIAFVCLIIILAGLITLTSNYALALIIDVKPISVFWDGVTLALFGMGWYYFFTIVQAVVKGLDKS